MRNTKSNTKYLATFGLLFGATTWGVIWYPYRLLQDAGIAGVASSFYTYLIALVVGLIYFARHWRGLLSLPGSVLWLAIAAGWTNLAYVLAVIDGEVMRVMLLFYLSPLWTLLLAHFWLHERTGRLGAIAITISLIGAFIMLWQPTIGLPIPQSEAEWMGLSAGIGFAFTNVLTRRATQLSLRVKSMAVWVGVVMMALLFLPFQHASLPLPQTIPVEYWLMMSGIGLALLCATVLVQYGITHTLVTRASVIFLFELVVAALSSYWLANETMQLHEWIGGSLIIAAAIFAAKAEET
jgi:drug/metabolite transporter (DMT)-like permease